MPDKETLKRVAKDRREGKSASTQAGEFIREEIHHIREGKHGARNTKQAIAIGLSKARRAGVALKPQPGTKAKAKTRHAASPEGTKRRSRAMLKKLKGEPHSAASHLALSRHAHEVARERTASERSASARKAAKTRSHTQ
jgi:hypothetical protein